ncbi:uncharacterized protein LOC130456099 [Monodelphis domestica]|uniref:uncharacterized protein LOC130456099 n=1 Tax=Monodelphis domestica TaxID=13616 RepID=UPI0024E2169A|nr:uncharacterized protein LOC130456099 [Monodelphis domestica]
MGQKPQTEIQHIGQREIHSSLGNRLNMGALDHDPSQEFLPRNRASCLLGTAQWDHRWRINKEKAEKDSSEKTGWQTRTPTTAWSPPKDASISTRRRDEGRLSQVLPDNQHRRHRSMALALPESMLASLSGIRDGRLVEGRRPGVAAAAHCQSHPYGSQGPTVRNENGRPRALPRHPRSPNLLGGFVQDDEREEYFPSAQIHPGAL